ncbi:MULTISPECIES: hypothetical protein [unclassified Methylobacterium]|uniref:hypothetical protein n=1 Tax=unclassified Methylobacterium TaxID=2615210 RepID=UPI001FB875E2|nr:MULTISPECIES: hypothetical protein [unclassified Methylobacterium]MCJ2094831.1 hypothetical protein [Methylobacterium sp. J-072]MCJ2138869.1 hypothetical protein [Methylobacterium sp. E-066]
MNNLERFYRTVHGRELLPWERQLAVRVAAALNTTTDDDFVVHLLLLYNATHVISEMHNELVASRDSLSQSNRELVHDLSMEVRRNTRTVYVLLGVVVASVLGSVWIILSLANLSHQYAVGEARIAAALQAIERRAPSVPQPGLAR